MPLVVITGGASGIGFHLVKRYAEEGSEVVSLDVNKPHECIEGVHFLHCDVGCWTDVQSAFERIRREIGTPSVLINNAAIAHYCTDILSAEVADFDRVIRVNLNGSYYCAKQFVELVVTSGANEYRPRIINVASTRYLQNEPHWEAYGASKGGVVALTQSLANSLAQYGVLCNAVSPGWIVCDGVEELTSADHAQHLSARVGNPEDIYRVCRYLCEADNVFITGQNIVVDGGMSKRMIYE